MISKAEYQGGFYLFCSIVILCRFLKFSFWQPSYVYGFLQQEYSCVLAIKRKISSLKESANAHIVECRLLENSEKKFHLQGATAYDRTSMRLLLFLLALLFLTVCLYRLSVPKHILCFLTGQ